MGRISALLLLTSPVHAQVSVLTNRYDGARTGANLSETTLTVANVNPSQFGKLYSYPVDGSVYAQPLYVSGVVINGTARNVLYVATMNDKVYAFDADSSSTTPLWMRDFTSPPSVTPFPIADIVAPNQNIVGNIGIQSTPVIDAASRTIYLVARTKESGSYFQRLHALDIATGASRAGSPVTITGSVVGSAPPPPPANAIGVDFLGGSTVAMTATETAGVVPKGNWNSASGASRTTPLALVDESGAATTATLTWSANGGWKIPVSDRPGDTRMMAGYLDTNSSSITTVTFAGLPSRAYDVYVYVDGDNREYTRTAAYRISGPGITDTNRQRDGSGVHELHRDLHAGYGHQRQLREVRHQRGRLHADRHARQRHEPDAPRPDQRDPDRAQMI